MKEKRAVDETRREAECGAQGKTRETDARTETRVLSVTVSKRG